jgi:hypothetical protein
MRAFEVHVNDQRACIAGIGNDGVLTAIVSWVSKDSDPDRLEIGALDSVSRQHVDWGTFILRIGDEVRIRLIDVELDNVDAPTNKRPAD